MCISLRPTGSHDQDSRIREHRNDESDDLGVKNQEYDELKTKIQTLQRGYDIGVTKQDKLEEDYISTAQDYVNSKMRPGLMANMNAFQDRLFKEGRTPNAESPQHDCTPVPRHPGQPPVRSSPTSDIHANAQTAGSAAHPPSLDEETRLRESVQETRRALWQSSAALDRHREEFYELRFRHLDGINPGFAEDWTPDWTMPDYDVAHLKAAMRLTGRVIELERELADGKADAKKRGFIIFDDQVSGFPEYYGAYTLEHEQMLKDHTPVNKIGSWRKALPPPQTMPSPSEPDDRGLSYDLDDERLQGEIEVWDSGSCAAEGSDRARIDREHPEGRLGGTEERQAEDYWSRHNGNALPEQQQ